MDCMRTLARVCWGWNHRTPVMMTCPTANYSDHVTNIESEVDNAGYTPEALVIMHTALSGDKHVIVEGPCKVPIGIRGP
jgi:hypothetical protein